MKNNGVLIGCYTLKGNYNYIEVSSYNFPPVEML